MRKFEGEKAFVVSTANAFGGRNNFLGYLYIVIGSICVVLGAIFTFLYAKKQKSN